MPLRCRFEDCGWTPEDQGAVGVVALDVHRREHHGGYRTLRAYETARLRTEVLSGAKRTALERADRALAEVETQVDLLGRDTITSLRKVVARWLQMLPNPK